VERDESVENGLVDMVRYQYQPEIDCFDAGCLWARGIVLATRNSSVGVLMEE
jgi:hypothetical protein